MNVLVPVFVAVVLAEVGGPLAVIGRERRVVALLAMAVMVGGAAFAGWSVAEMLVTPARTLLLGLALLVAGVGALVGRRDEPETIRMTALTLYRSPTPFLAFAFSAWVGTPLMAGAGALAGVAGAVAVGTLQTARSVRVGAGIMLCAAGIIAALNGLRLV